MEQILWQIGLGLVIGAIGTLIGVGGGFILVPVLIFLYPSMGPDVITAISLAMICANGTSGSIAYARLRRIDYRAGLCFALAGLPGAVIGVIALNHIPLKTYRTVFALTMLALAVYIFFKPSGTKPRPADRPMQSHHYNLRLGMALSLITGFISSILGIGGGLIHVPMMVYLLHFPVHTATATSHFVLAIMTAASTVVHICNGDLAAHWPLTLAIIAGVIPGAQIGARISGKISGHILIRLLAVAIALAGIRIIMMG